LAPYKASLSRVDTSGRMDLHVRAPPGVSIRTQGFFKKMDLRRSIQMPDSQSPARPEPLSPFA
jgi:hypothetical protein